MLFPLPPKILIICLLIIYLQGCCDYAAGSVNGHSTHHQQDPEFSGEVHNITAPVGKDVKFSCHVRHLGTSYKVAWIHFERSAILTVHSQVITRNPRIGVSHENHRTWHLHISDVQESDRGRYLCQINTAQAKTQSAYLNVVVPPTIEDSTSSSDVIVREGSDLTLSCHARGSPTPSVKWRREDGRKISSNKSFSSTEVEGSVLELPKISRLDMGVYHCIASNGVPPTKSKRIFVSVDFPPMVWVPQQLVGAPLGSTVTIECWLEAHPAALHYWAGQDGQVLHDVKKYGIEAINNSPTNRSINPFNTQREQGTGDQMNNQASSSSYMTHLKLTIRNLTAKDFTSYRCVAKNPRGETDGTIKVYQTDQTGHVVKDGQSTRTEQTITSTESTEDLQTDKQVAGTKKTGNGDVVTSRGSSVTNNPQLISSSNGERAAVSSKVLWLCVMASTVALANAGPFWLLIPSTTR